MKKYVNATSFRKALEDRLKRYAEKQAIDFQRIYRQVAFDRLLARIFQDKSSPYLLKGGYAMELRMQIARATKDVDLSLPSINLLSGTVSDTNVAILEHLQELAGLDLEDYFQFLISEPILELDAAPYGGARFLVESRLDGRVFSKFHLDVGVGDSNSGSPELLESENWLDFAGFPAVKFPSISREQQFSEKIHAYSVPRAKRENSRVKDLVDLLLLINSGQLDTEKVTEAVESTFKSRATHAPPELLAPPPQTWDATFAVLALDCQMDGDIAKAFNSVAEFWRQLGINPKGD